MRFADEVHPMRALAEVCRVGVPAREKNSGMDSASATKHLLRYRASALNGRGADAISAAFSRDLVPAARSPRVAPDAQQC
jgi:hypothetical protein